MDAKRIEHLGRVVDGLRAAGYYGDANALLYGGTGTTCCLCGLLTESPRDHRCWEDTPAAVKVLTAERDALRDVIRMISTGVIGKSTTTKTWWHACGFYHGESLLQVLQVVAEDGDPDAKAAVVAVEAALAARNKG